MAQKVFDVFGIELNIDPDVNEDDYKSFHDQLVKHLKALPDIKIENVEVYIHQLRIRTEPTRFGVSPLQARLSKLDVSIQINKKAKESKLIWFLNPDLDIRMNPSVNVKARRHSISYSLPADYLENYDRYNDYIATIVKADLPEKLRKLRITGTAHATARFTQKILNFKGTTTTKMEFRLTKDRQLPLRFGP